MMADFSFETWQWLASAEAETLLREELLPKSGDVFRRTLFLREKKGLSPERASAVATLLTLREKGKKKFPDAERMFFTPVGLEQSTDAWVAAYKASRFPAGVCAADVCTGVGGDLCALAGRGPTVGVEKDAVMAFIAELNLESRRLCRRSGGVSCVICMDAADFAERFPPEEVPLVHVDPDRRPAGIRSSRMEFFSPTEEVLERILAGRKLAAVKLAPGSKPPEAWCERGEMEWISRDGECRQLVAWMPSAEYEAGFCRGMHRATIIAVWNETTAGNEAQRSDRIVPLSRSPLLSGHCAGATFPAAVLCASADADSAARRSAAT